jgi:hypothetical protein
VTARVVDGRVIARRYSVTFPHAAEGHVLACIDPAQHTSGVAMWHVLPDADRLLSARAVRNYGDAQPATMARLIVEHVEDVMRAQDGLDDSPEALARVVVVLEKPVKYRNKTAKHNGVDAINEVIKALPWRPVTTYTPGEWKGNTPKGICEGRLRSRLVALTDSSGVVEWTDDNAVDALGISMYTLGYVGRGCV